jgi:hypothetical protein
LPGTNALAYYGNPLITAVISLSNRLQVYKIDSEAPMRCCECDSRLPGGAANGFSLNGFDSNGGFNNNPLFGSATNFNQGNFFPNNNFQSSNPGLNPLSGNGNGFVSVESSLDSIPYVVLERTQVKK